MSEHIVFLNDFQIAEKSDSFRIHNNFLNSLLQDHTEQAMEWHYRFFNDSTNEELKQILGKGFIKRKEIGAKFLLNKLKTENDSLKKSNIIHLLGLTYNSNFLIDIIPYLEDINTEIRYKAIIACGWLGDFNTIDTLIKHFYREKIDYLRAFTITAMRQIYFKDNDVKSKMLQFLHKQIISEENEEVTAVMIVVIQDLVKIKYGLKENSTTGEISGNINKAKNKILKEILK